MVVNKKFDKNDGFEDALNYIAKGAQVRADMEEDRPTATCRAVCMRVPINLLRAVDRRVKLRAGLTRTAWILEAVQQKLKAEEINEQRERQSPES